MSALISIRLNDELFKEMRLKAEGLHLSQAEYVREAIVRFNAALAREEGIQRLKKASLKVRANSMDVNKDFSDIENDPDA